MLHVLTLHVFTAQYTKMNGKVQHFPFFPKTRHLFLMLKTAFLKFDVTVKLLPNNTEILYINSWDTSKTEGYYWSSGKARTLAKNRELSRKSTNNYGCIREPLLHIPIENIRVDELHLLLRVTGNSLQNATWMEVSQRKLMLC